MAPGQLTHLGIELLDQKRAADAVEILKLNVEVVPKNANVLNLLARAYREAGDTALARQTYQSVLQLDPKNQNAIESLEDLKR